MSYKIDTDIPIPSMGRPNQYPFAEMKVGDSFFIEGRTSSYASTAARNWASKHEPSWRFTSRQQDGGVRVWRIE